MASLPAPDGRRTAATWVAATGAFLLVAAAAVFVGVHWDRIPDVGKLSIVVALTGGFLLAGRGVRRTLPATGDVLFHLGAFLIPVDVAALAGRAHLGWRQILLVEGATAVAAFTSLAAGTDSVVLRWAAAASAVPAAAGVAAVSPLPAPLVLVAAAVVADRLHGDRLPIAWSAAAATGPLAGAAVVAARALGWRAAPGAGVLRELGLAGHSAARVAVLTGAGAAWVLARGASRRRDVLLGATAVAALFVGTVASWGAADPHGHLVPIGAAVAFIAAELGAGLLRRDPVWARPLAYLATAVEVAVATLLVRSIGLPHQPAPYAAGCFLAAAGWLLADGRRSVGTPSSLSVEVLAGSGWAPATVGAVGSIILGATAVVHGSALALVLAGLAAALVLSGRPLGHALAAPVGLAALPCTAGHPAAGVALAAVVAATFTGAARIRARMAVPGQEMAAPALVAAAAMAVAAGAIHVSGLVPEPGAVITAIVGLWVVSLWLEDAPSAAWTARGAVAVVLLPALMLPAGSAAAAAFVMTLLFAVDAVRLDDPRVAVGCAPAVQVLIGELAAQAGLHRAEIGLALAVAAVAWAGLSSVVDARWRSPFLAASVAGITSGLLLASDVPARLSDVVIIAGGLVLAAGITTRRADVLHLGGATVTLGVFGHLRAAGVTSADLYVAPVAVQLLVAGWQVRRQDAAISSWVAYTPAIALFGGVALAERVAGGSGWHAVAAGAAGAAAVAAGGARRLAGPLVAGTVLLVATVLHESLGVLAGSPTWAWLALGGATLLATGIALERTGTSPTEAGRRLVDVVADRFS